MVEIDDLRRAGHSTTNRAWITNPARRLLFPILRPYLARLAQAGNEIEANAAGRDNAIEQLLHGLVRATTGIEATAAGRSGALEQLIHELTQAIKEIEATAARRVDAIEHRLHDLATRQQSGAILKNELVSLGGMLDALRKDQTAANHRLGNIEDETEANQRSGGMLADELRQFGQILEAVRNEELATQNRLGSIEDEAGVNRRSGALLRDELGQLGQILEAVRNEQLATQHRLGSIESDMANSTEAVRNEQLATQHRLGVIESDMANRAVVGMTTLPQNQPIAIFGTSFVFHAGPYGRFLLRQPDLISDHILAGAFWDSHLKPVIERTGRPDRTALDAGAYIGFHSAYMARYFRTVHAFEPQIEIYRMLCTNLLLNNCSNVTAINAALYDVPGYMRLADGAAQEISVPTKDGDVDYDRVGNAAALTFRVAEAGDTRGIPSRTVDELGLTDLGFMKVDTQGSDLRVLRGARMTIERCRPVIVAEFERELSKGHGDGLEDYYSYFEELGYDIQVLEDRGDGKQMDLLATPTQS